MKELLIMQQLGLEIHDFTLFENIHAHVKQGEIIGIIGKNGAGKTTLLKLLNNELTPTKGSIQWFEQNLVVALVDQEAESFMHKESTATEEALRSKWSVPDNDYSNFSGGEKLKARLIHGIAKQAHLLLLDEPTNHLDANSTVLLIEQLKRYNGTVILVSHDRYFLDEVATKIWSIEGKKLVEHKGNYSSYMEARQQRRLTQQREYEKQQKMVEQIESQMQALTSWSKSAHAQSTKQEGKKEYFRKKAKRMDSQVKSKQKRLEKELEKVNAKPVEADYNVQFTMKANDKVGKRFLEVKNLAKSFNNESLFSSVFFTIQHGEKVAIVGPNGSGKTTLLKIILGIESYEGEVWLSPSASIGYLTQEVFDLPLEKTPEQLFYQETFKQRGKVQTLMNHLGFTAAQWREPIQAMSMGERVKCKLMKYILEEKDVLVLDEPTNHLDLASREQLEATLSTYNGTLLVVSHDRYFLEQITATKLVIQDKKIEKQWDQKAKHNTNQEEYRLTLETERQAVLGKLSFLSPNDQAYIELDKKFTDLTKQIRDLK
ncbi:ABC-F type ribosomal protection protein [Aquibacillus koreensis]|uniref:Ribosome protection protein VmlR n=1 Tax=Aquibacillus koreensis TaxID=279446 RepID=A0A9X4AI13_9BACI|nr:ABC-F type ribosomal protection protein [Aquibacillus koreensis]MCT2535809.1 ABC-F type ribosomal protection protein [Aquibacillus koreensis]MDC3420264.1 ABC-F type ribosomal protection protein [Aquibacillus koreensis]